LRERNVGNLYLAVSHGIFSNGFGELAKYFERVFTTNSRSNKYVLNEEKVVILLGDVVPDNFLTVHNIF